MSYVPIQPSLASATGTNLDSACKHIQQCRVSQDHMTILAKNDAEDLKRNKARYCVHKDEFVLGIGKPWQPDQKKYNANAYPHVLSNLGKLADKDSQGNYEEAIKMIKYMYHNVSSIPERNDMLKKFQKGEETSFIDQGGDNYFQRQAGTGVFHNMVSSIIYVHDFIATGYANTQGFAHAGTGDTMTSVMIGGLRTVRNGDFDVQCGDLVQWYWPFERDCFYKDSRRKPIVNPPFANVDPASTGVAGLGAEAALNREENMRKRYYDREFGQLNNTEKVVAYIKPYKRDDQQPRMYDWYRVFARAISSARPHEKVDIMIARQAL